MHSHCICIAVFTVTANIGYEPLKLVLKTTFLKFDETNSLQIQEPYNGKYITILFFKSRETYDNFLKLSNSNCYVQPNADVTYPRSIDIMTARWLLKQCCSTIANHQNRPSQIYQLTIKAIQLLSNAISGFDYQMCHVYYYSFSPQ